MELQRLIDKERLELDSALLRKMYTKQATGEDIDNLVCDTIDKLIDKGMINHKETIDVAYYIASEIKINFIL